MILTARVVFLFHYYQRERNIRTTLKPKFFMVFENGGLFFAAISSREEKGANFKFRKKYVALRVVQISLSL